MMNRARAGELSCVCEFVTRRGGLLVVDDVKRKMKIYSRYSYCGAESLGEFSLGLRWGKYET